MGYPQVDSYQIISYPGNKLPEAYKPLVFSKWLRSLRYGNDYFKLMEPVSYYHSYHLFIEKLLANPSSVVRLAVLQDDYDVVLGFSVCRANVVDYLHVQRDYRRKGIGTALVPADTAIVTHLTRNGMSFWASRLPKAKFDPFQ
jgi:GNAT superfamily N-acetyltransferase